MKPTEYDIEVYGPGSRDSVWMTFESPTPFGTISKGDVLDPNLWPDSQSPMKVLRVVELRHIIWERPEGQVKHRISVFTEEVENYYPHELA